jgi:ABC-type antimicrobial peptide transport system permease subunit
MFTNYLKITYRNLIRQKGYTFINLSGLILGLSASILIFLWVFNEFSVDRFHKHGSNIYRVNEKRHYEDNMVTSWRTPGLLADHLKDSFHEIDLAVRHAWTGERMMSAGDQTYYEDWIVCVDPSFFSMFTFPFLDGDRQTALSNPNSIVISKKIADKYFGNEDPIGKTLTMENRYDLTITGVIQNVPSNSHFRFDMAVPFEMVETLGWITDSWDFSMASTYIKLNKGINIEEFQKKIAWTIQKHNETTNIELILQPLKRIYLYSNFNNQNGMGRIQYVLIFTAIGILILIMACINYMNLSTARSEKRSKEIAVRKVIGADRKHLIWQFQSEAFILVLLALLLSPLVVSLILPEFNKITEGYYSLAAFFNIHFLLMMIGIITLTGFISGSYPSLFLSTFQPVRIFHGVEKTGRKAGFLRKTLVFIQISISLLLIIASTVIIQQIDFLKNMDLGFNKDYIVTIPLGIGNRDNGRIYNTFKNQIQDHTHIRGISGSWTHPLWFGGAPADSIVHKGIRIDEHIPVKLTSVDFDYIETFQIQILQGRDFQRERGSEMGNWIVNEQFAKLLNTDTPLGEIVAIGSSRGRIIGVMKDFNIEPVTEAAIGPIVIFHHPNVNNIFVRVDPDEISATISYMEKEWINANPGSPFQYSFLDEEFNHVFREMDNMVQVIKYFTFLAVFIACLGLFGLASFSAEDRRKEIGIRKVLGSSENKLVLLLCSDYLKLILFASLLCWPAAYLLLKRWLINFPYAIAVHWTRLLGSSFLIMIITLLTISFQAIRAARTNPVNSLKYE